MLTKVLIGVLAAGAIGVAGAPAALAERDIQWSLGPAEVEPGGQLYAETLAGLSGCNPATPLTSPGFVAPITWEIGGNWGKHAGYTTAVKKPGKYTATFTCYNGGPKLSKTFTVLGTPDPTPTPTKPKPTSTPTSKPKPAPAKPAKPTKPQVPVKPVGAPETGGGGTASS